MVVVKKLDVCVGGYLKASNRRPPLCIFFFIFFGIGVYSYLLQKVERKFFFRNFLEGGGVYLTFSGTKQFDGTADFLMTF